MLEQGFLRKIKAVSLCVLGFHERSKGHAKYQDQIFRSKCRNCQAPMLRDSLGHWKALESDA